MVIGTKLQALFVLLSSWNQSRDWTLGSQFLYLPRPLPILSPPTLSASPKPGFWHKSNNFSHVSLTHTDKLFVYFPSVHRTQVTAIRILSCCSKRILLLPRFSCSHLCNENYFISYPSFSFLTCNFVLFMVLHTSWQ